MQDLWKDIEINFRLEINAASYNEDDIQSEYEDIIRHYKSIYPIFRHAIDKLFNKMDEELRYELNNLEASCPRNSNISNSNPSKDVQSPGTYSDGS